MSSLPGDLTLKDDVDPSRYLSLPSRMCLLIRRVSSNI